MTSRELIEKIENGNDIMLDVAGKHLTIITWLDDGIGIDEQAPKDGNLQVFPTAEDLVNGYRMNGAPLAALAKTAVITSYT